MIVVIVASYLCNCWMSSFTCASIVIVNIVVSTLLIQKSHFDSFKGVGFLDPRTTPSRESFWLLFGWHLWRVTLTLLIVCQFWLPMESYLQMTLERVRMQINSSEVSFYTDLESFRLLFGRSHFDPTSESKRLLKSRRHIRRVKMTLRIIVLKWLLLVKTTLLNLQCMLAS